MKTNNKEKSVISTLFTEKELAELQFTPEEIEMIEDAENMCDMIDLLPDSEKDIDAFFKKFDTHIYSGNTAEEIAGNFFKLAETDPKFFNQVISLSLLLDEIEEVPEAKVEKISSSQLSNVKLSAETAKRKAEFDKLKKVLDNKK